MMMHESIKKFQFKIIKIRDLKYKKSTIVIMILILIAMMMKTITVQYLTITNTMKL
jgi:hypothetical protein